MYDIDSKTGELALAPEPLPTPFIIGWGVALSVVIALPFLANAWLTTS